jgi:hypothetical protein
VGRKWNLEIIAVSEIYVYIEPASIYFLCEGQISQPPTVTVSQVVTEINVSPLFLGELGNDHCDDFCQLKFDEICFV